MKQRTVLCVQIFYNKPVNKTHCHIGIYVNMSNIDLHLISCTFVFIYGTSILKKLQFFYIAA